MEKLGEAAKEFENAYNLMMRIVGDLEDHYYEGNKKEERKFYQDVKLGGVPPSLSLY